MYETARKYAIGARYTTAYIYTEWLLWEYVCSMRCNGTTETADDPACVNARPRQRRCRSGIASPSPCPAPSSGIVYLYGTYVSTRNELPMGRSSIHITCPGINLPLNRVLFKCSTSRCVIDLRFLKLHLALSLLLYHNNFRENSSSLTNI